MTGTYDSLLVALSYVIAAIAAYVALTLASRMSTSTGRAAIFWLLGGAAAMGTGIWSMHFIGMLAFRLPIPLSYDVMTTLLSLLIAILVSGFALYTINRKILTARRLFGSALLMGVGIAAMHYTGMAAFEVPGRIVWDPILVGVSIALGGLIGAAALFAGLRGEALIWSLRTANLQPLWRAGIPAVSREDANR